MKKILLFIVPAVILLGTACQKTNSNKMPTAIATASTPVITGSATTDTLIGSGKDADGTVVTNLWEQISGPASSTIADPGAATTAVTGLVSGTYVFQLSVFDNEGGIGTDTAVITVNGLKTLTLQPSNNPNEWAIVELNGVDKSGATQQSLDADAWTSGGYPYYLRALVKFDLTSVPATSIVQSAHLFLYSDSTPINGNQVAANYGNNAFYVQQVASNWSTSTVNWSNQPAGRSDNQILIPSTTQSFLDLDVDVTAQVASMVNNSANYGFLLKLQTEDYTALASRIFIASNNANHVARHPKLVVTYQ